MSEQKAMAAPAAAEVTSMIERLATDPAVDADKLERLFALQQRARDDEAAEAFNAAMVAVQSEVESVHKSVRGQHSNYADLGAVMRMLKPILDRHAVAVNFGTDRSPIESHYGITARVSHGRHAETYRLDVPVEKAHSKMTGIHAAGSALTYGRRYLLSMVFNVPLYDDDGRGASRVYETLSQEQHAELSELIEQCDGLNVEAFLKHIGGYEAIDDISARDFVKSREALKLKIRQQREADK